MSVHAINRSSEREHEFVCVWLDVVTVDVCEVVVGGGGDDHLVHPISVKACWGPYSTSLQSPQIAHLVFSTPILTISLSHPPRYLILMSSHHVHFLF